MYYYGGFMSLVVVSLWVSLIAFVWALKSGQFSDQSRARYLPLVDEMPSTGAKVSPKPTVGIYALLFVIAVGMSSLVAAMVLSLYQMKG
jgi:cbb3-type cytochrome oxidase maturation protein